jgi:hypothetical protein
MHIYRKLLLTGAALLFALTAPTAALAAAPSFDADGATITGDAEVGSLLDCDAFYFSDGGEAISYQWRLGSKTVSSSSSYTVASTAGGLDVTCTITVTDPEGTVSSSKTVTIADSVPGIAGAVHMTDTVSAITQRGPTCSVNLGPAGVRTYGGHTTESVSWTVNGVTAATVPVPIPVGATGHCTITVTNALGSASANSADGPLTTLRPRGPHAPTISGIAAVGNTLSCNGGGYDDLLGWTVGFQWMNGATSLGTGPTLVVPTGIKGTITCRGTASYQTLSTFTPESDRVQVLARVSVAIVKGQKPIAQSAALAAGISTKLQITGSSCKVGSVLTIPAKLAKQLGLLPKKSHAKYAVVGSRAAQIATGSKFTTNTKFSAAARAKLKKV